MIFDLIDYVIGELKVLLYKLLYRNKFKYHLYSKISKHFELRIFDKGILHMGKNIVIRAGVKIRINQSGKIIIGNSVGINNDCLLNSMSEIRIGDNTIIGQGVKMYDHDHLYKIEGNRRYTGFKTSPIYIGKNVWIGSDCIILKGSKIGDNSVIGAGTIVKGIIPNNSMVYNERVIRLKKINSEGSV